MPSIARSSQNRLIDQAKAGDPLALGPLLESYTHQLRFLAEQRLDGKLRNRAGASDIVQETLLQATRDFSDFRGRSDAELAGWLRRILARIVSRQIERHVLAEKRDVRREIRWTPVSEQDSGPYAGRLDGRIADHRPGPASAAVHTERQGIIDEAIASLPNTYRQIIQLRNVQGLAFDEIAARLNRTSGATRMLWLRAIEMLRKQLKKGDS